MFGMVGGVGLLLVYWCVFGCYFVECGVGDCGVVMVDVWVVGFVDYCLCVVVIGWV